MNTKDIELLEDFEAEGEPNIGYKLFKMHKDGSLGPIFINKKQRLKVGVPYEAEDHPTKGYTHRPGWHLCARPHAPHLKMDGRVWCKVEFEDFTVKKVAERLGTTWYLANMMKITEIMHGFEHENPFGG